MSDDAMTRSIASSVIRSVTYEADATLTVRLHRGSAYRYFMVPRTVFEDLLAAASTGTYFNRHIRDGFPYQRVS
jgi:hypothetical protein